MRSVIPSLFALACGLVGATSSTAQAPGRASGAELRFAGNSVELTTVTRADRSILEVMLGGRGPYAFFVDTGAGVSVLDAGIAAQLELESVGTIDVGVPGGTPVESDLVALPPIRVGDLEIVGATAVVLDIATMSGGLMQGVLGMDLFGDHLLTLDPGGARIGIGRGALPAEEPGVVQGEMVNGRLRFPVDVAGRRVMAQIDHGSPSGITFGSELLDSLPTDPDSEQLAQATLVGGTRAVRSRTLRGSVQFAGLDFQEPRVGFMDPSPGTTNIGSAILNDLVTTVDLRNARLLFSSAPVPAATTTTPPSPRRLGVRFGGPGAGLTTVGGVDPGSLGEQAGLRAGDVIVTLNGRPMVEFDVAELGALIRSGVPLRFELDRGGELVVVEIG